MKSLQNRASRLAGFTIGRSYLILVFSLLVASCAGDSCSSCQGCDVISDAPFPTSSYNSTIPNSGHIKVTNNGFNAMKSSMLGIVTQMMKKQLKDSSTGSSITLCVPPTQKFGAVVCPDPRTYNTDKGISGSCLDEAGTSKGCALTGTTIKSFQLLLEQTSPTDPAKLTAEITLGNIDWTLPVGGKLLGLPINCSLKFGGTSSSGAVLGSDLTIKVPILLKPDLKDPHFVTLESQPVDLDGSNLGIAGSGLVCRIAASKKSTILDGFKSQIPADLIKDKLCKSCPNGTSTECGVGQLCSTSPNSAGQPRNVCYETGKDPQTDCVPAILGKEALINFAGAIPILSSTNPKLNILAAVADDLTVKTDDSSGDRTQDLTLALRSGFQPQSIDPCAVDALNKRSLPSSLPISSVLESGTHPVTGKPFQFGMAYHKDALNDFMWGVWASGSLCTKIDSNVISNINSQTVSLLANSLAKLTPSDKTAPIRIVTRASNPPTITLGENRLNTPSDGAVTIDDPLMTINIDDFQVEMYAFIKERWVRLFTMQTDIVAPVAMSISNGKVESVIGELAKTMKNIRITKNFILAENDETMKNNLEAMIPVAMQLAGSSLNDKLKQSFDLTPPAPFDSLQIEMTQDDLRAIDNNNYLGIFFKLAAKKSTPSSDLKKSTVELVKVDSPTITYPTDSQRQAAELPSLVTPTLKFDANFAQKEFSGETLPLSGDVVEYRYRVDDGGWSNYRRTTQSILEVDDLMLAIDGDHDIEIEARLPSQPETASTRSHISTIRIDQTKPEIYVDEHSFVVIDATSPDTLNLRYRVVDDAGNVVLPWSTRTPSSNEPVVVDLAPELQRALQQHRSDTVVSAALDGSLKLEIEANDGHDNIATTSHYLKSFSESDLDVSHVSENRATDSSVAGGCSSTDDSPANLIIFLFAGASLLAILRRRRRSASAVVLAGTALLAGCQGCESKQDKIGGQAPQDPKNSAFPPCVEDTCKEKCAAEGKNRIGVCDTVNNICQCKTKALLPLGEYGEYNAISGKAGEGMVVATYNTTYNDLMVQFFTGTHLGDANWLFVDGLPDNDPTPEYHSTSYRGGSVLPGPDAGKYADIYLDSQGVAHVSYQADGKLKYARVKKNGDFKTATLDDNPNTGAWTQINERDGKIVVLYSQTTNDDTTTPLSTLYLVDFPITENVDDLSPTSVSRTELAKTPLSSSCATKKPEFCRENSGTGSQCVISSGNCVKPDHTCADPCPSGFICSQSQCHKVYQYFESYPQYLGAYTKMTADSANRKLSATLYDGFEGYSKVVTVDETGVSSVASFTTGTSTSVSSPYASPAFNNDKFGYAYMNTANATLNYKYDTVDEVVVKGRGESTQEGYTDYFAGQGAQLTYMSDKPVIFFQDPLEGSIKVATKPAAAWVVEDFVAPSDQQPGFHGFFLDLYNDGTDIYLAEQVVDLKAQPAGQTLRIHKYSKTP